jgi:hypothetical protein
VRRDGSAFDPEVIRRVTARLATPPDDDMSALARDMLELRLAVIVASARDSANWDRTATAARARSGTAVPSSMRSS